MKKKLPQSLLNKQESERRATESAVTDAIIELQSQGYNVRIKDLIFVTELSRSVFAKPHIRRILVEYSIIEPSDVKSSEKMGRKQSKTAIIVAEKDGYIDRLIFENEQLRKECEILRGQIHLLMYKKSVADNDDF
jgi:hypothetical protein